jgi:hypothetical protein
MSEDIVRLRGHHLLCILTYIGMGYTPHFTENMTTIAERINQGALIEIVEGPDDICAALLDPAHETCAHARTCTEDDELREIDQQALIDVSRLLHMPVLKTGDRFKFGRGEITHTRVAFKANAIRSTCRHCPWNSICTDNAANNFPDVKLMPHAVPKPLAIFIPSRQPQRASVQSL